MLQSLVEKWAFHHLQLLLPAMETTRSKHCNCKLCCLTEYMTRCSKSKSPSTVIKSPIRENGRLVDLSSRENLMLALLPSSGSVALRVMIGVPIGIFYKQLQNICLQIKCRSLVIGVTSATRIVVTPLMMLRISGSLSFSSVTVTVMMVALLKRNSVALSLATMAKT